MEWLLVAQILALLVISAVMSGSETGLYSLSRIKLRYRLAQDDPRARKLERLINPLGPTIIAILIGNNIANQLLASAMERGLTPLGDPWSVIVTIVALTPLVLIFGEFLPKYLFHRHADNWLDQLAGVLTLLRWLLAIPVRLVQGATWLVERVSGGSGQEIWEPHTSRPNLRTFLAAGTAGHDLSPTQSELVDRVLVMERITLAYEVVSKPLSVVESLDAAATAAAIRKNLAQTVYQRYLVGDHETGKPIGYITAVDLVCADGSATMGSLARALPVLKASTPLHHALHRMHAEGAEMCLVLGENGSPQRVAFRGDCVRVMANLVD
jgi:putative hemolysin